MRIVGATRRFALGFLALIAMLLAACGQTESPLQVGIQRAAVDLAFQDEEIEVPEPEVRRIVQEIAGPVAAPQAVVVQQQTQEPIDIPPPVEICPQADPNAVITEAVVSAIRNPPEEGVYTYMLRGSVTIELTPAIAPTVPLFGMVEREVSNVHETFTPNAQQRLGVGDPSRDSIAYDVRQQIGTSETRATYHLILGGDARGIHLEKWQRTTGSGDDQRTLTFEPGPTASTQFGTTVPQRRSGTDNETGVANIYQAQGPGRAWRVDSVDMNSQMSYVLDHGRISAREQIDMCGELIDTYRSETTEQISRISANPDESDYVMQTHKWEDDVTFHPLMQGRQEFQDGKPNVRNLATHWGPLPVYEEHNFTEQVSVQVEGAPVPIYVIWKYSLLLMSQEPEPLEAAS